MSVNTMTKHYTELSGADAERVQLGAPRYDADQYFLNAAPIVRIGLGAFSLRKIGAMGFSLDSHEAIPLDDKADAVEAIFEQNGVELATARILTPSAPHDRVIECHVFDRAIDIEKLATDNAAAVVSAPVLEKSPLKAGVPTEYKIFCADVLDTIANWRRQIEKEIAPFEHALSDDEKIILDKELEESVREEWRSLVLRGDDLILPYKYDKVTRPKIKQYTENLLTRELVGGVIWNRSYTKPLGYPGDYRIMDMIYEHDPIGEDTYSRFLYTLGLIAAQPIAARMEYLTEVIEGLANQHDGKDHFHVMSIGSGPACELKRMFQRDRAPENGYSITLVDPEIKALNYAISSIYGAVKTGVSSVMVSGMNTSFTEMLRPNSTFRHLPPQDLIYSAGLVDYLNPSLARKLISKLYEHLRPGGSVLIGNVNDHRTGIMWLTDYVLEWPMYFRNHDEMMEIADGLPGEISLTTDPSDAIYMLKITKPA
ncbi:MAG: class I SAM-dependent methyltransferase [Pseudomonadota bacterium]